MGWAGLSSANTIHRDPLCDSDEARKSAETFLSAAIRSYEGTRHFLSKHSNFDRGYVFNGRFAVTRGAFRALQHAKIPVFTHERGCSMQHYQLFPETFPHDLSLFQERVEAAWTQADDPVDREKIGSQFFLDQKSGQPLYWESFAKKQILGKLPDRWNKNERNVVIFNSSEDGFK